MCQEIGSFLLMLVGQQGWGWAGWAPSAVCRYAPAQLPWLPLGHLCGGVTVADKQQLNQKRFWPNYVLAYIGIEWNKPIPAWIPRFLLWPCIVWSICRWKAFLRPWHPVCKNFATQNQYVKLEFWRTCSINFPCSGTDIKLPIFPYFHVVEYNKRRTTTT